MRKATVFCIAALVAVAFIALGTAGESYADKKSVSKADKVVTLSGTFNGTLADEIRIGTRKVVITRHTTLRSTVSGELKQGHLVVRKPVYINAVVDRYGQLRATLVLVNDGQRRSGGELKELSSDAAR